MAQTMAIGGPRLQRLSSPGPLIAMLLVGAALNGFWVRVVASWQERGLGTPLVGLSPFELAALAVSAWAVLQAGDHDEAFFPLPEVALGVTLLYPSSNLAWLGLAGYAAVRSWFAGPARRTGFLLALALACCSIWSSELIKPFASLVSYVDVHAVAAILSWFRNDIEIHGNVVGVPAGHNLVVLTVCSTAYGLPRALLGLATMVIFAGGARPVRWLAAGVVAAVVYTAINLLRLCLMTWSSDFYWLLHLQPGGSLINLAQTLAVVLIGLWAAR
jgi:hypothetical protein